MPSSWDVYYVVFLSALLALGVPALLAVFSYLVSAERKGTKGSAHRPAQKAPTVDLLQRKINARVFLGVNAALILLTLALALIPCAGLLQDSTDPGTFLKGLVAVVSIAAFCGLGLLYSSRKGDLSWIRSFQKSTGDENPNSAGKGD